MFMKLVSPTPNVLSCLSAGCAAYLPPPPPLHSSSYRRICGILALQLPAMSSSGLHVRHCTLRALANKVPRSCSTEHGTIVAANSGTFCFAAQGQTQALLGSFSQNMAASKWACMQLLRLACCPASAGLDSVFCFLSWALKLKRASSRSACGIALAAQSCPPLLSLQSPVWCNCESTLTATDDDLAQTTSLRHNIL
jgi:hypothetical protein